MSEPMPILPLPVREGDYIEVRQPTIRASGANSSTASERWILAIVRSAGNQTISVEPMVGKFQNGMRQMAFLIRNENFSWRRPQHRAEIAS